MMIRFVLASILVVEAAACGRMQPAPTAPSAPPAAVTSAPAGATSAPVVSPATPFELHVTGVVREDGDVPVAGATISNGVEKVVTDARGSYEMTIRRDTGSQLHFDVSKDGYESTVVYVIPGATSNATKNIRLYSIRRVIVGDSVHLSLSPDDRMCGLENEFLCRRVHVMSPVNGTVTVTTKADDARVTFDLLAGEISYPFRGTPTLVLQATAGADNAVDVLVFWNSYLPAFFTLTTAFSQ
jgi:hypothetical protein